MRDPSSEAGTSPVGTPARPMAGDASALRTFAVSIGICWAILFLVLSARYQLQLYGDGALFSYALAVQETWSFHWHNISGRILVYRNTHATSTWTYSLSQSFSAPGFRVHTPLGPRKSGMPESVEMPAPVSTATARAPATREPAIAMASA